jgi:hypothetical protein
MARPHLTRTHGHRATHWDVVQSKDLHANECVEHPGAIYQCVNNIAIANVNVNAAIDLAVLV